MNKDSLTSIISAFNKAEPGASHSAIADIILEEYPDIGLSHRTLRLRVSQYRSRNDDGDIDSDIKDKKKYYVKDEMYFIEAKNGHVKMPVKTIDQIFLHYSKHGYNLTGDEVIARFDLNPESWLAIKNHLRLFKTSDILSPHTRETTPKEELEKMMDGAMEDLFRNKAIVTKKYRQSVERAYKRVITKNQLREAELSSLVMEIMDNLDIISGEEFVIPLVKHTYQGDAVVTLADLHIGVHFGDKANYKGYSINAVEEALDYVADVINSYGFKSVRIALLGDLIHSFTGNLHHEMWREMDIQEGIGGKVVVRAAHILARLATKILNFVAFEVVEGNHDRATKEKSRISNEMTLIISEMIQEMLKNTGVSVNFHNKRGVFQVDGINYIISHGEDPIDSKDVYRVLNRAGIQGGFTVILKAHKHSRMIHNGDDNWDCRRIHCPSIFTRDSYTASLGFKSLAGFNVIHREDMSEGDMALPRIIDHPLEV